MMVMMGDYYTTTGPREMMDSQGPAAHEPRRPRLPVSQTRRLPKGGSCGLFPAFCDGGRELEIAGTYLISRLCVSIARPQKLRTRTSQSSRARGDPILWLEMSGGRPN